MATDTGNMVEWVKFYSHGISTSAPTYAARGDYDGDGNVDIGGVTGISGLSGPSTGYNVLTRSDVLNAFGYTGQRHLIEVALIDMRNQFYGAENQTFIQRDLAGFVDGANVDGYVRGNPIRSNDPMVLALGIRSCADPPVPGTPPC